MRSAGEKKPALDRAYLQREREFLKAQAQKRRLARRLEAERHAAVQSRIRSEIDLITAKLRCENRKEERVGLRAELAHLRKLLRGMREERKGLGGKRNPPEAGLPVPALPPKGPLPKQGGAAAPLDFGTD